MSKFTGMCLAVLLFGIGMLMFAYFDTASGDIPMYIVGALCIITGAYGLLRGE